MLQCCSYESQKQKQKQKTKQNKSTYTSFSVNRKHNHSTEWYFVQNKSQISDALIVSQTRHDNNTNTPQNKTLFQNETKIFWRFSCIT